MSLVKKTTALAWELRNALMMRHEVVISVRDGPLIQRVRGYVVEVAATDVNAAVDDARWDEPVLVQLDAVLTIRRPHYHEEGETPVRNRPIFEPHRGPEVIPGQLLLGGTPPNVSKRTRIAMERAAGMLLPQDLLDVLGALDRASRGKESVPSLAVADELGASLQWTVRRLSALAEMRLAFAVAERPYSWTPGE